MNCGSIFAQRKIVDDYLFIPMESCLEKVNAELLFFGMPRLDVIRYHNFLVEANQLHGKHDRFFRKWHILLAKYRCPEKSQPKIPKWLNISVSSCMTVPAPKKQDNVDKCCKYLFIQINRSMDNGPPTRDVLLLNVRRGMSQSDI